jgi:RNA polymerase sigma-32 factor
VYKVRDEARDTVLVALVKASVAEVRDLLGVRKHHLVNTLAGAVDDEGPDHVGQTRARGPPVAQTKVRRKAPTRKQPKAAFRAVATDPEETSEEAPESTSSSSVNIEAAPDSRDVVEPNDAAIDSDAPPPMSSTSIERFDAMSAYLREVQRHPLLTADDTRILAEQFVQTQRPELAARLVTSNLRLVVKIAYEYRRAYKNIMDLVQEGNIGLMQAVRRYDPSRGVKLSSYAAWWIRAYILRFILNNWRLVKLGTTQAQRKLFFNLRKKRAELVARGIDPTNAEIAKQLNVDESDVAEMDVRLTSAEGSLDAPIGDAEGRSIAKIDMMPAPAEGPEALLAGEELQALLKTKLQTFRETLVGKVKEIAIFDERLVSDEPLTLQELGTRFGISRERVRQLEHRLTGRLREFLQAEMGDATEIR